MIHIQTNKIYDQKRIIYQLPNGNYLCRLESPKQNYDFTVKYMCDALDFVEFMEDMNNDTIESELYLERY